METASAAAAAEAAQEEAATAAKAAQVAAAAAQRLSQEVDVLTNKKHNLHRRCLELFSQLTEAQVRIAELESVVIAMRYAATASPTPGMTEEFTDA